MEKEESLDFIKISPVKIFSREVYAALENLMKQLTDSKLKFNENVLKKILSSENSTLIIASDSQQGNKIVGTLSFAFYRIPTGLNFHIEDVVVDEAARGMGVGRKLMLYAIKEARKMKADKIDLTSSPGRIAANRLYQSMGFQKRDTNVYRLKQH